MGIHEDQIKLEPLGDDVDENNNDEPLENGFGKKITLYNCGIKSFSYPEPFLRAVRRGALAKSKTGYHKNMVKEYIRY
jgi:hypothetical protein